MKKDDHSTYQEIKDKGTEAALRLLERTPDPDYLDSWTELLGRPKKTPDKSGVSVIVFRLGNDWLAIETHVFSEVLSYKNIHRIPHRTNATLMGLVNYQGTLKLCLNMHHFLSIVEEDDENIKKLQGKFQRMVSIEHNHEQWIFPVDEVHGIFRVDHDQIKKPPVNLSKSKVNYLRGMIEWHGKHVAYIDYELLFYGLRRNVL
jgi:chemotaxis-related protein WspD